MLKTEDRETGTDVNPMRGKSADTYNAAVDHFDAPPLGFWDRHGRTAAGLADLRSGDRVLDVGCGTGASALPAGEAVGNSGQVIGIDVAEAMLQCARMKAAARGLRNVRFCLEDMTSLDESGPGYDAVISVFSIFFTPDMDRQIAALWRQLRAGGRLVVTVWGDRAFEPLATMFGEELHRIRPDLPTFVRPWERLTDPENFGRMIAGSIGAPPQIVPVDDRQPLSAPADLWSIVLGSGYRWEVEQLGQEDRKVLKTRLLKRAAGEGIASIETPVLHAVAQKTI